MWSHRFTNKWVRVRRIIVICTTIRSFSRRNWRKQFRPVSARFSILIPGRDLLRTVRSNQTLSLVSFQLRIEWFSTSISSRIYRKLRYSRSWQVDARKGLFAERSFRFRSLSSAYHGHLTTLVELSTYKFKKANTNVKIPEHVHVVCARRSFWSDGQDFSFKAPIPDVYRGKYRDVDYNHDEKKLCQLYVNEVRQVVEEAESRGRRFAIFLIESLQSCGGQIIYPKGYLKQTFE